MALSRISARILAWSTVFPCTFLLFMGDKQQIQYVYERDPAAQQAKALKELHHTFQVADEVYRRFRLSRLTTELKQDAPRIVEWIPISNN